VSKAFTKESDDFPDSPIRRRGIPVPELNLVTPSGLAAARAELDELVKAGGDADRVRELTDHLATAQAADPPEDRTQVALGATVTLVDDEGNRYVYRIVGAIESDPKSGRIGWQSPLAQALWGAKVGDEVALPRAGRRSITAEIERVEY
jgi:transcription elongation GreA/GreB family factor